MSPIETIGVVGGGLMGSGIAECAAAAGIDVIVSERDPDRKASTAARIERSLEKPAETGKRNEPPPGDIAARIQVTTDIADLAGCALVIEAVPEDLKLKQAVFAELSDLTSAEAILATNTSSIPVAELASIVTNPGRVLGLHFFSPVPAMRLVEVVRGLDTSDTSIAAAHEFARRIGKEPIETPDRSGFIVNMLLVPYLMAAVRMFEEGFASREDIDKGMKLGCGHPVGPLRLCDMIGIDVLLAVCDSLFEEFKRPEYAPPPLMKRMVAAGRLGRKAGYGFYEYAGDPEAAVVG